MKWFMALPLVFLPCLTLAETAEEQAARRQRLLDMLPSPDMALPSREEALRRDLAIIENDRMRRVERWSNMRDEGKFLEPEAMFPYQMTFAEGAAEAGRLVGIIEGAGSTCLIVLAFDRPLANATRVRCGEVFSDDVQYDVVERSDGVSVYRLER